MFIKDSNILKSILLLKNIFILFFLSLSVVGYSQLNEFDGSMMNNQKKVIQYHISLYLDSFNQISGYSYKNNDSVNKNYIEGYFIDSTENVFFKEYNLYSNNTCPFYFNGLIKRLMGNIFVIAGVYQSKEARCSDGHINLINFDFKNSPNAFKNLQTNSVNNMDEQSLLKTQKLILNQNINKDKDYKIVKGNSSTNIKWKSDSIYIKIFDHEKVDGDKVKLSLNQQVIAESLNLTNEPSVYKVALKPGKNILKIKALNDGVFSPNTSKIELYYDTKYEYYLNFLENKSALEYIIERF